MYIYIEKDLFVDCKYEIHLQHKKPSKEQNYLITWSNIFTNSSPCLDLFNKHPVYQYPPVNVKNKQTK